MKIKTHVTENFGCLFKMPKRMLPIFSIQAVILTLHSKAQKKFETSTFSAKRCVNYFLHIDLLKILTPVERVLVDKTVQSYQKFLYEPQHKTQLAKQDIEIQIMRPMVELQNRKYFTPKQREVFQSFFRELVLDHQMPLVSAKKPKGYRRTDKDRAHLEKQKAQDKIRIRFSKILKKYNTLNSDEALYAIILTNPSKVNKESLEEIKFLLRLGADQNYKNSKNISPLEIASSQGNRDVIQILLKANATISLSALIRASAQGYTDIVELFLPAQLDINRIDGSSRTALTAASEGAHKETVELLLKNGALVKKMDARYRTSLMAASSSRDNLRVGDVLRVLIESGAAVDEQNNFGQTALMVAKTEEATQTLIEQGANPNLVDKLNHSALMYHVTEGLMEKSHFNAAARLIEAGADVTITDKSGHTVLDLLLNLKDSGTVSLKNTDKLIEVLENIKRQRNL